MSEGEPEEIDVVAERVKNKYPKPVACVWYLGGDGQCGKPLAEDDICFCQYHREIANQNYREVHHHRRDKGW